MNALKPTTRSATVSVSLDERIRTATTHGLFAHIHGTLSESKDRGVIDRLWNPIVDSWYKHGKDDPNLLLIKFDATRAEIWESDALGTLKAAALKWAFDVDPGNELKKEHQADVSL